MSRDSHGNCQHCPIGQFQPNDLTAGETTPVQCDLCGKGTFADIMLNQREWLTIPSWLNRQKCSSVAQTTSTSECIFHQRKWRANVDALAMDTGIPEGMRISIGGNMKIGSEFGGTMTIEYETSQLRRGESFLVFIDGVEQLNIGPGTALNQIGYSVQKTDTHTFSMSKGDHLIQFSGQSVIRPPVIASYWDTQSQDVEIGDGMDSLAEIKITSITFTGTVIGGAFECLQCPKGTISEGETFHCLPCLPGSEPNKD